ncbi:hypothetical protein [Pedobacter hiemivivus]|uniref:Uncharacterized protein n=1 Tax=Pedobacter hiemivivus TaxID=2530454 RepID=A0A4R0NBK4_9SPHI|nr:hypothetical protein [Pedobacter hiemivivus]TCC97691.1 hypothetical protein EZ444_07180 [Pedobacter hiemivivus]
MAEKFGISKRFLYVNRIDVSGSTYSTGHMGMSGENVFVFKNANQFYYYERLGYSEGTFEWVNDKSIKLTSKVMGFDIPYKDERHYKSLNEKLIVFKGDNLFFEGFILRRDNVKGLK